MIKTFRISFETGKQLVLKDRAFRNRLEVYNYVCEQRMGIYWGEVIEIKEV